MRKSEHDIEPREAAELAPIGGCMRLHPRSAEGWADLYEHNWARVLRYVRRLIGNSGGASAEDLTHEAFLIAFATWENFRGSSAASTWLCGIAFKLVRRHLMREAIASRMLGQFAACDSATQLSQAPPDTLHDLRETELALLNAARELPGSLQEAFVLHCLAGLSAEEAAAELGVSRGNLRVRVARARVLVKQRLATRRRPE
jgi:RNA polymerase sigma-70 factor (ECF subfamily)